MSGAVLSSAAPEGRERSAWRDVVALTKPRITAMAVAMAALAFVAAILLEPAATSGGALRVSLILVAVALVVAAANALNMALEVEVDRAMERTRERPLPQRRLRVGTAVVLGVGAGVASLVLLAATAPLTALLSAVALVNYVLIYTPLKQRSTAALPVGAISGAMPILMGWTAATGRLEATGLLLFAVLWAWQIPHFLAISIVRQREYEAAGVHVVPTASGRDVTRVQAIAWATALVPLSLTLVPAAGASLVYVVSALAAGGWFLWLTCRRPERGDGRSGGPAEGGSRDSGEIAWARRVFHGSLVHAPAIVVALVVDAALRS